MPKRDIIRDRWSVICENFTVPKTLHDHQVDTIVLVLDRENVLCALPTGSGKTLAQLATVLFTEGTALVIPPLLTIEKQMCDNCDSWGIRYVNLSTFSNIDELQTELEIVNPHILIASVEKISDSMIQKALMNVKLEYVAIDEAQV